MPQPGEPGQIYRVVPFTGQNGKLVIVADVARLLPRLWDGQRALRFLAGLAMLALAFAANAGLIGPAPLPAASAPVQATVAESAALAQAAVAESAVPARAAVAESVAPAQATAGPATALPESVAQREKVAQAASVVEGHHGAVGLGVHPVVLVGLLGLVVVVARSVMPGAGRFARGVPAQRGPPRF